MTAIEWTDQTWNPIVGCSVVSPGCANCYAMKMAARIEAMNYGAHAKHAPTPAAIPPSPYDGLTSATRAGAVWNGKVAEARDDKLLAPLRRKKPTRYFVNSMGDLFHEAVPDAWIDRVFAVMALAPQHTFQVLTKRAKRMREYLKADAGETLDAGSLARPSYRTEAPGARTRVAWELQKMLPVGEWSRGNVPWPLPNVHLGVSCERQQEADERIPDLLATPAAVRFVSAEPLLAAIDFTRVAANANETAWSDALRGHRIVEDNSGFDARRMRWWRPALDWIIVGGESGADARPMHPDWARSIRDQCAAADVPFFFKQWGEWINVDEWLLKLKRSGSIAISGIDLDDLHPATFGQAAGLARNAGWRFEHHSDGSTLLHVGKRRAGRLLDGVEHNALPRPPFSHKAGPGETQGRFPGGGRRPDEGGPRA